MNCKWVEGRVPKVDLQSIQVRSDLNKDDLKVIDSINDVTYFR